MTDFYHGHDHYYGKGHESLQPHKYYVMLEWDQQNSQAMPDNEIIGAPLIA